LPPDSGSSRGPTAAKVALHALVAAQLQRKDARGDLEPRLDDVHHDGLERKLEVGEAMIGIVRIDRRLRATDAREDDLVGGLVPAFEAQENVDSVRAGERHFEPRAELAVDAPVLGQNGARGDEEKGERQGSRSRNHHEKGLPEAI